MRFVRSNVGAKRLCALASLVMMLAAPGWAAMSDAEFLKLCEDGTAQEVCAALDAGANVNAKDKDGITALMVAAEVNSNPEVINVLLKAGADVNEKDEYGGTALMSAAYGNNLKAIDVLLKAGADVNVKDKDGKRAIDYARANDKLKGTDALKRLEELSK